MLTGAEIRRRLDDILPTVAKPARYLGLERNLVRKSWDSVPLHLALLFPDAYEIGMSHQGTRILYHLVNRRPDAVAERAFAPWPDMAAALRDAGLPLYALESCEPIRRFEAVGITLQSELNYVNLPYVLDLAGITRRAGARAEDEPIVLGGGPCTANPEPVAPFFDAILLGDAEVALDAMLDAIRDGRAAGAPRADILRRLAAIRGVYVPTLYRWTPAEGDAAASWESLDEAAPLPVARVWAPTLDAADQPDEPIVPFAEVVQERLGMEIMRGCTQGCRFCQAGYWYRPVREHDAAVVADRLQRQADACGFHEVGLLSLSTADYSQVEPLVYNLSERLADRRVSVNLPSLRADAFSVGLAEAVSSVRKSGFTFAPETGSDRLRRVINKTFTNADMVKAAEAAFARGWTLIKVYAMIGLPTENDDDLAELARLAEDLVRAGRRASGRKVEVKVSVGCFVPKSWTPFQWEPYAGTAELERRIGVLKGLFRRIRGARLSWNEPAEAALEAVLSRGDRRLADTVERAHDLGAVFDGWSDLLRLDAWHEAARQTGVDWETELARRPYEAVLPWDHIDSGVRKGYLRAEMRRALREHETEDCRWGRCYHCGIPGDGEDTQLSRPSLPIVGEPLPEDQRPKAAAYRLRPEPRVPPKRVEQVQAPVHRRYRITFAKRGDTRYLSHRLVMDALERALRASGAPVHYTEGFNPHIRLSMGPALATGHEGLAEVLDVDCVAPLRRHHLDAANRRLPEGLELLDTAELLPGAPSLGKLTAAARYLVGPSPRIEVPATPDDLPEPLRAGVSRWEVLPDGRLRVELNLRQAEGPTPGVKDLLLALGAPEDELALVPVARERLVLRPMASPAPASATASG